MELVRLDWTGLDWDGLGWAPLDRVINSLNTLRCGGWSKPFAGVFPAGLCAALDESVNREWAVWVIGEHGE